MAVPDADGIGDHLPGAKPAGDRGLTLASAWSSQITALPQ
jgi:hypothetical protein